MLAIHAVDGMAGVGKSAFAIHAAHRLVNRFPDGAVFLSLHAHTAGVAPLTAETALGALLLGDGLNPSDLPPESAGREQLWRKLTATRRMLLVLDDAADAAQIRPLLPTSAESLVLITSRRRLTGLDDVVPINMGVLDSRDAAELFVATARRPGLDPSDPDVKRLVALCGYLPLAVTLTAARLRHHMSWTPADLIEEFQAADSRLQALSDLDRTVVVAFDRSYQDLPVARQRLFRLLGAHPGVDFEPEAAAALLGADIATARRLLMDLEEHRLLDETVARRRWRMHDLVRQYASDTARNDPQELDAALTRLLEHYATRPQRPWPTGAKTGKSVRAWLRAERENLLACLDHAYRADQHTHAVRLNDIVWPLLRDDGPSSEAVAVQTRALELHRRLGDRHRQAGILVRLGRVRPWGGRSGERAAADLIEARELCRELDNPRGQAVALMHLGRLREARAEYDAAMKAYAEALELYRQTGSLRGQAAALHRLGWARWYADGKNMVVTDQSDSDGLVLILDRRDSGAPVPASSRYAQADLTEALDLYRELGDLDGQADVLRAIGRMRWFAGDEAGADALYRQEQQIREQISNGLENTDSLK